MSESFRRHGIRADMDLNAGLFPFFVPIGLFSDVLLYSLMIFTLIFYLILTQKLGKASKAT